MTCWRSPTTKDAYRLSWVSLLVTLLAAIGGITLFIVGNSTLALVYGLENCVDFLSSAVVLWRFFAPSTVDKDIELKLKRREKRASVAISFILLLLGIFVIVAAAEDIKDGQEEIKGEKYKLILTVSFLSILVFGTFAAVKFQYAKQLDSPSLNKDGICSLIGAILSVGLFIDTLIIKKNPDAWWIDPLVALGCGIAAVFIGLHALYSAQCKEGLPICSISWWFLSQGDDRNDDNDVSKLDANAHELALTERGSNDEPEESIV